MISFSPLNSMQPSSRTWLPLISDYNFFLISSTSFGKSSDIPNPVPLGRFVIKDLIKTYLEKLSASLESIEVADLGHLNAFASYFYALCQNGSVPHRLDGFLILSITIRFTFPFRYAKEFHITSTVALKLYMSAFKLFKFALHAFT